jgi:hypothetical protein
MAIGHFSLMKRSLILILAIAYANFPGRNTLSSSRHENPRGSITGLMNEIDENKQFHMPNTSADTS